MTDSHLTASVAHNTFGQTSMLTTKKYNIRL